MTFLASLFGGSYEDLWKAVIRPNRDEYENSDLGPEKFEIKDKFYKRTDLTLKNKRNLKLKCSFWEPYDEEREYNKLPCVVYLHGNSSSRCEVVSEIKYLLPLNITVFAFDFAGCGKSEGEYISLGYFEKDDVECVIDYLRKSNKVSTIGLWGRSMGAVTALMYGDKDPSIAGIVCDSAFSSLKVLIEELVKERVSLPNFIVNQAVKLVKSTIKEKAHFNLDEIEPIIYAKRCFIPALFCHGKNDTFVLSHHSNDLFKAYVGDKNIVLVEGNHNSTRPRFFKDSVSIFFYNTLQLEGIKQFNEMEKGMLNNNNKNDINLNKPQNNPSENKNAFSNNNSYRSNNIIENDTYLDTYHFYKANEEDILLKQVLELSKKEYEELNKKKNNYDNNSKKEDEKIQGSNVENDVKKDENDNFKFDGNVINLSPNKNALDKILEMSSNKKSSTNKFNKPHNSVDLGKNNNSNNLNYNTSNNNIKKNNTFFDGINPVPMQNHNSNLNKIQ